MRGYGVAVFQIGWHALRYSEGRGEPNHARHAHRVALGVPPEFAKLKNGGTVDARARAGQLVNPVIPAQAGIQRASFGMAEYFSRATGFQPSRE